MNEIDKTKTKSYEKKGRLRRVVKIVSLVLASIIVLPIIALFIGRGVNDIWLRLPDGVRDKTYIELGGVEQYINIRGADTSNPVIIFLHGGPGGAVSYITPFQQNFEADYTCIYWDQRGCGRSYIKSPNAEISFEILLKDLDDLVDYAAERFSQPIIIVGHSWGTILGITYAEAHPDKLAGYIGMSQVIDQIEAQRLASIEAARLARGAGNEQDALEIEVLFQAFSKEPYGVGDNDFEAKLNMANYKYLPWDEGKDMTIPALLSSDFDWDTLRWELLPRSDMERAYDAMEPLFKTIIEFAPPDNFNIPIVFITGSTDNLTPAVLVQEYSERLIAPKKEVFIIPELGHNLLSENLEVSSEILRKALAAMLP